ncbi:MAG: RNA pyrophosphohydrolase [Gammaproteobacteria bacterium]|nr:RNA pyrophosphohydrolase [Gammaproteobacteria bacterium]
MIDAEGYRANVAIVMTNGQGKLFWAKRVGMDAWQFPQGGIKPDETAEKAMYRELHEETGLQPDHVEVIGFTNGWLRYQLPKRFIRKNSNPLCIGQKQVWYLLKLLANESHVKLDTSSSPEFDLWRWIDFWGPVKEVIEFKRPVYKKALMEFEPLLFKDFH